MRTVECLIYYGCVLYLIVGMLLFLSGMFINIHSDHILRNLRKPGETGYKIPKGREAVSCCHLSYTLLDSV